MSTAQERYEAAVRPERPTQRVTWILTALVVLATLWSLLGADVRWSRLLTAPAELWTIAGLMFGDLQWDRFPDLLGSMWESIAIAWVGTLIAAVFAIPLSFLAAENLAGKVTVGITRQVLNALRAVPEIIIAIALVPIFGLTPLAGTLAIGIGSIGSLGKLNAEIIEGMDRGPLEAADAVGAGRLQRLRWGAMPQVLPELAAFTLYRFEINIRASSVLGVVGAGGIGSDLAQNVSFRQWGVAGLALIIVVVATIIVDTISGAVRRRIIAGPRSSHTDGDELEPAAVMAELS